MAGPFKPAYGKENQNNRTRQDNGNEQIGNNALEAVVGALGDRAQALSPSTEEKNEPNV